MAKQKSKTWIDELMDKAETIVGGMERAAKNAEGVWAVTEITDAETGDTIWNVSDDGRQKIHVFTEELAEMVASLLNK